MSKPGDKAFVILIGLATLIIALLAWLVPFSSLGPSPILQIARPTATAPLPTLKPVPTSTPVLATMFEVWANLEWQDTGVVVSSGQSLEITAEGTWSHGLEDPVRPNPYGPNGTNKFEPKALLPTARIGALIGRIGTGQPFLIGEHASLVVQENGTLQLSINEHPGYFKGNSGSLRVTVLVLKEEDTK